MHRVVRLASFKGYLYSLIPYDFLRAVEDLAGGEVVGDFLQGERGAEQVFSQAAPAGAIGGSERGLAGVEGETAVAPGK